MSRTAVLELDAEEISLVIGMAFAAARELGRFAEERPLRADELELLGKVSDLGERLSNRRDGNYSRELGTFVMPCGRVVKMFDPEVLRG